MLLINLAILFAAFGLLARLSPCNPGQPAFFGRDLVDNLLYWFTAVLCYGGVVSLYVHAAAGIFAPQAPQRAADTILSGYGVASHLPLVVQVLLIVVATDFVQYWVHRLFHGHALWPLHAIHHSVEDLDWSATYRNHPLNFLVYSSGVFALVRMAGFSSTAFLMIGPINLVFGALVHANLNWTYGPFRYVVCSPVYHRWHHAKDPAAHNSNFAPTFPIWDLMFGTYYMPAGVLPGDYGVDGVPPHFFGQMLYPLRIYAERLGLWRKPRTAEAGVRAL
jgi:sterol desaturase/sphingolipid hydroxylase (fatty acid hydroxylase superfamily)